MEENRENLNQNQETASPEMNAQPGLTQSQALPQPVPEEGKVIEEKAKPKIKVPKLPKKVLIAIPIILVVLIFLVVLMSLVGGGNGGPIGGVIPDVSPTPTPEIQTEVPSPYANDPEVIAIQEKLKEFDSKLNSTVLREDTLRIPSVDWDISF